jgi:hypothetical protein
MDIFVYAGKFSHFTDQEWKPAKYGEKAKCRLSILAFDPHPHREYNIVSSDPSYDRLAIPNPLRFFSH